ncbi:MAG: hypothetical protein GY824_15955, partial [Delftia sp.]|nr:hypothetical protein [Delftia sp.]
PLALTASAGWDDALAHLVVICLAVFGSLLCVLVAGRAALQRWPVALASGLALTGSLALLVADVGPGFLWFLLTALSSWAALGQVLTSAARPEPRPGGRLRGWRSSVLIFLALVTMLVIIITVTEYDMLWMTPVGGAMLALAALWASRVQTERARAAWQLGIKRVNAHGAALIIVVALWAANPAPQLVQPLGPLRVMVYNIHQGLDADNRMDLQAIAAVIAAQDPDVLVLNEVNRARATNGFVDTLALISHRLDAPFIFGPNYADGQYGNALLSRYPILEWDNTRYSRDSTEIRGLLRAVVQAPGGPLTLYATHLDHVRDPGNARAEQVSEMLAAWSGKPRAILLGDLNAEPDAPELQAISQAGFVDALAATGQDDAFSYWDPVPRRRIDYIFLTPDLALQQAWVVQSRASDHLPVLVEVQTLP